jgi:hypothetical protein
MYVQLLWASVALLMTHAPVALSCMALESLGLELDDYVWQVGHRSSLKDRTEVLVPSFPKEQIHQRVHRVCREVYVLSVGITHTHYAIPCAHWQCIVGVSHEMFPCRRHP